VRELVRAACDAHAQRRCDDALALLQAAREAWEARGATCATAGAAGDDDTSSCSSCGLDLGADAPFDCKVRGLRAARTLTWREEGQCDAGAEQERATGSSAAAGPLGPQLTLFFGRAAAGVLLTAGRDAAALRELRSAAPALAWVHEAGAEAAAWHGAAGVVMHHLGDLQVGAACRAACCGWGCCALRGHPTGCMLVVLCALLVGADRRGACVMAGF
jgi:hypothetical protein